jgi:hypothetical protein
MIGRQFLVGGSSCGIGVAECSGIPQTMHA